jgi:hypothetical protein
MVQEQTTVPSATGHVFSAWRKGLQMALNVKSRQCSIPSPDALLT